MMCTTCCSLSFPSVVELRAIARLIVTAQHTLARFGWMYHYEAKLEQNRVQRASARCRDSQLGGSVRHSRRKES